MNLQVGVKILLKNSAGKYLLLERNFDKYTDISRAEKWDIVGGRINPGTPLLDNLKREIFEETKLTIEEEPRLIMAQDIIRPDKHVVRLTYTASIEGEPQLDDDHVGYQWLTKEEITNLENLDQYLKEALTKL